MKTVRLTYRYSEVDPSVFLLLYFRMIGVYMSERFLNSKLDLKNEISIFRQDFASLIDNGNLPSYDAEIFLISNADDYQEYQEICMEQKICKDRVILVICDHATENEEIAASGIKYADKNKLLQDVLDDMLQKNILDNAEYEDCRRVSDIYSKSEYMQTTLSTKYFFTSKQDLQYEVKKQKYMDVVKSLNEELRQCNLQYWGENVCEHLQFAMLNTAYEADLYSKRSSKAYIYTADSLLSIGREIEKGFNTLVSSVKILMGQIYDNLMGDANKAYEYYLEGCDLDKEYDAYVFLLKGQYWQNFIGDYQKAAKYYLKSIMIYPEYYRAWYKMGYCYYKLEQKEKSFLAFDSVRKILYQRLTNESIRPMEIEHLFHACNQCAGMIYEKYQDAERAIQYHKIAENAWDEIKSSRFIDMMSGDDDEKQSLKGRTQNILNIEKVYKQIVNLCRMCGKAEEAKVYEEKLINFNNKSVKV